MVAILPILLCYYLFFVLSGFSDMSLKRTLYSLLLYLIFPFVLLRLLIRSRTNANYRKRWSERLACISPQISKPVIWLHAVSVGEAIAAKPLIEGLLENYPHYQILVTTTTPTGSDRVSAIFDKNIQNKTLLHSYFPYDLLGAVSRFIKVFKPHILIVVETEIWPNLYAKCDQKNIPIIMVNARLSEKSTASYVKFKGLVAETLSRVNIIAVRSNVDKARFITLGAKEAQIKEIGNIKYDIRQDAKQIIKSEKYKALFSIKQNQKDLILVAASTHKGEDEQIVFVYLTLLKQYPALKLILVPRHPERFDEVYEQTIKQVPDHLTVARHSQIKEDSYDKTQRPNIVLGDSMGEMQMWFALADIAFIGGSLVDVGGHNPLEATLYGVPVVSGSHMFNFEDVSDELSAADLLFVCDDEFEVAKKFSVLLSVLVSPDNADHADLFESQCSAFMQKHQGVSARLLAEIDQQLITNPKL